MLIEELEGACNVVEGFGVVSTINNPVLCHIISGMQQFETWKWRVTCNK
jgi:hypothetical protein